MSDKRKRKQTGPGGICPPGLFLYGAVTKKCVIYRGEPAGEGEIEYLNAEEYLRGLPGVYRRA